MSFILDALKKAEQERSLGRAPDLQKIHTLPELPRRRFWPWLLASALLINAAMLTILLIGFPGADTASLDSSLAASAGDDDAIRRNNDSALVDESSASVAATTDMQVPVPVDTLVDNLPALPEPRLTTTESLLPRAPLETGSLDSSWSSLELPQTGSDPYGLTQPGFDSNFADEQTTGAVAMSGEEPLPADLQVMPLHAMPADFRNALPILNLDVHVYSAQPERRFVLINSKRYQQGDHLDEGPLVETITEEGVVLSFLNQQFSLNVQR